MSQKKTQFLSNIAQIFRILFMGAIARLHKKGGIHLTYKEFKAKMKKSPAEVRREVFVAFLRLLQQAKKEG